MTTLRQNFIRELVIRGTSPRTQEAYVRAVYCLAKHYRKSPDQLTDEELKNYLFYLANERHLSASSLNQCVSAFRFFYEVVLQRPMEQVRRRHAAGQPRHSSSAGVQRGRSWSGSLPWAVRTPSTGRF